ncbi:MAG: hypothetical protein R3C26_00605 [Calditrichia bacterium]
MNLFAVQERNHYLLNGVKSFVITGDGDFWIVAARTDLKPVPVHHWLCCRRSTRVKHPAAGNARLAKHSVG